MMPALHLFTKYNWYCESRNGGTLSGEALRRPYVENVVALRHATEGTLQLLQLAPGSFYSTLCQKNDTRIRSPWEKMCQSKKGNLQNNFRRVGNLDYLAFFMRTQTANCSAIISQGDLPDKMLAEAQQRLCKQKALLGKQSSRCLQPLCMHQ